MTKLKPMIPVRDENGWWTHPDFPENDESWTINHFHKWAEDNNFDIEIVFLENEIGFEKTKERYWEVGASDCEGWEPTPPNGDGWFIVSIHDTQDGPVCIWLRNKIRRKEDKELINVIKKITEITAITTCVGCGCDDNHACVNEYHEVCHWLRVNRNTGLGVCSQCAEFIDADIDSVRK
ncbi:hypothetical protein AB6D34_18250 [Pectobacterium brasiliense]|uniref:Uncharacterized protein n=1 Tax=Pectobacterium brasiliense TaxID=180957 RepID=A0A433NBI7_9GAMM|nr:MULTISPECIES: hypothetical protein [Pectobacterium]GKW29484.1 hypothetical protein PEC331060_26620 [Pectobacterium carotovorum subsp. carotovorum]MBN3048114.1 hypothetical protein [Pectobacterium brasiliense]MBN3057088.1 hypothetical protein [Pectobacterium brasiliense]MBN3077599.1 hypothetical protein [Pectobacterium brasiliense]MBN3082045.1 hypothetical protein [Pectobacterium polaris]